MSWGLSPAGHDDVEPHMLTAVDPRQVTGPRGHHTVRPHPGRRGEQRPQLNPPPATTLVIEPTPMQEVTATPAAQTAWSADPSELETGTPTFSTEPHGTVVNIQIVAASDICKKAASCRRLLGRPVGRVLTRVSRVWGRESCQGFS